MTTADEIVTALRVVSVLLLAEAMGVDATKAPERARVLRQLSLVENQVGRTDSHG